MKYVNEKFMSVTKGDVIQCKTGVSKRTWKDCMVLTKRSIPLNAGYERLELRVKVLNRKNYCTWIFSETNTNL